MRVLGLLPVILALAACVGGGRVGPGEIPSDALGAMYTDRAPEQLAACIAQAIGGNVQARDARFMVTSPTGAATYDVGPNAVAGVFPTEILVRGIDIPAEQQRAGSCFATAK